MSAARTTLALALICFSVSSLAGQATKPKPEDTEVWTPVPRVVTPARTDAGSPLNERPPALIHINALVRAGARLWAQLRS